MMVYSAHGTRASREDFRHDDGQAVSIPRGLELPGEEVTIRQDGPRLVIEAAPAGNPNAALLAILATLKPIHEHIGAIEDYPPEPFEL